MGTCPGCDGTRLSDKIRSSNIGGLYRALLLSLMFLFTLMTAKAQDEPPIVLSGDRTIMEQGTGTRSTTIHDNSRLEYH